MAELDPGPRLGAVPPRSRDLSPEARAEAAEFAAHSADALRSTLNLRRTLGRLVDLAVPRFGVWAGVLLVSGTTVRTVAATAGTAPVTTTTPRRRARAADLDALAGLADAPRQGVLAGPADLVALGAPADVAAALCDSQVVVLTTVPLSPGSAQSGVLAVAGPVADRPEVAEVAALARRGAAAVAAAQVFEERATLAERLRASLVPARLPHVPGVELGASYRAAQEAVQIGGDFYEVFPVAPGTWSVSIGDVCGKGVDAAVLTGQVRQSLRTAGRTTTDPAAVLALVNDTLLTGDGDTFVTVLNATMRPVDGRVRLRLAGGGHPPPLLLRDGAVSSVPARGTIIGMLDDARFTAVDLELGPGDTLLMYTDGAPEARGPAGLLDVAPIADLLADCSGLTAQAVTERVLQLVLEHLAGREHDDIALLAVRAAPPAAP